MFISKSLGYWPKACGEVEPKQNCVGGVRKDRIVIFCGQVEETMNDVSAYTSPLSCVTLIYILSLAHVYSAIYWRELSTALISDFVRGARCKSVLVVAVSIEHQMKWMNEPDFLICKKSLVRGTCSAASNPRSVCCLPTTTVLLSSQRKRRDAETLEGFEPLKPDSRTANW